jgi:hypothetical protein
LSRLLEKTTENLLLGLLRQLLLAMLMGVPPLVRVMGLLLWTMMSPMVMARGGPSGDSAFDGNPVPPTSGGAPSLPSTVVEMENERAYILKLRMCLKK